MIYRLLYLSIFLNNCAGTDFIVYTTDTGYPDRYLSDELFDYLLEFQEDAADYGRELASLDRLEYDDSLPEGVAGRCTVSFNSYSRFRHIKVKSGYLPWQLKGLVYHEFGHCLLGLGHANYGIMLSEMQSEEYYKNNWLDLVKVLFSSTDN